MTETKQPSPHPTGEELRTLALALIHQQSTMTLATAENGLAWAAPVYYVFYNSAFYFLSDPESRHIQETVESNQASAAIHASGFTWLEIRGIQVSGQIKPVTAGLEVVQAIKAYLKKFPFTKEFFKPGQALNMKSFEKRFRVRLYRFIPTVVFYLDNRIRFGFRGKVILTKTQAEGKRKEDKIHSMKQHFKSI